MTEAQVALMQGPTNGAQAHGLGHLMAHLGDAAARDHERDTHLCGLDDHLAGQPAGGVERQLRWRALEPGPAGDGVDRVVPAHVFNEEQHLGPLAAQIKQRAGVHRAS